MKQAHSYLKITKKPRNHKVTSVNLDPAQIEFLDSKSLMLSPLIRDLLDDYLMKIHGPEYNEFKKNFEGK